MHLHGPYCNDSVNGDRHRSHIHIILCYKYRLTLGFEGIMVGAV